jgi:hypothetical protein
LYRQAVSYATQQGWTGPEAFDKAVDAILAGAPTSGPQFYNRTRRRSGPSRELHRAAIRLCTKMIERGEVGWDGPKGYDRALQQLRNAEIEKIRAGVA